MKQRLYDRASHWLANFILTQLVVACMSLPILAWWGLPISLMTPISNLIFAPILSLFILLSALLVGTELCTIPNAWIASSIEAVTYLWTECLSFGSNKWLIGITVHHTAVLGLMVLGTFALLYATRSLRTNRRSYYFAAYLLAIIMYGHILVPSTNQSVAVKSRHGTLIIERENGTTKLIDKGGLSRFPNPEAWIQFSLRPEIIRLAASLHIAHIKCYRVNKSTLETLSLMPDYFCIDCISLFIHRTTQEKLSSEIELMRSNAFMHGTVVRIKPLCLKSKDSVRHPTKNLCSNNS